MSVDFTMLVNEAFVCSRFPNGVAGGLIGLLFLRRGHVEIGKLEAHHSPKHYIQDFY